MAGMLREWSLEEFARRLKAAAEIPDRRFAFFLGAGCSVGSGIPTASQLVANVWLPTLKAFKAPARKDTEAWVREIIPDHDPANPARSYGPVIEMLFPKPADRQAEFERLCEKAEPDFAYSVLARLAALQDARFNVVLTTNFDDLVADALYLFTEARPLVIQHESLAAFIRPTRTRPLVVKLHGDHRLAPMNTTDEVARIQETTEAHVRELLIDRGLIFLGYGGADAGIAGMLKNLPPRALHGGVYWVNEHLPPSPMLEWLQARKAIWVKGGRFEDAMLLLQKEFSLPHPKKDRFDRIFQRYAESFEDVQKRAAAAHEGKEGATVLKQAADAVADTFPEEWRPLLRAISLETTDPAAADQAYRKGIAANPASPDLLGSYANFLKNVRKDHAAAETFYKRALEADPNRANNLGNYALFLKNVRKDHAAAETFYKRALEADPNDANHLGNYAGFILSQGRSAEGLPLVDRALANVEDEPPLLAELWFYAFAHRPADERPEALRELKRLVSAGARSPGWDFSGNVGRAEQDGHPDAKWLPVLADVISQDAPVSKLDEWPAWGDA